MSPHTLIAGVSVSPHTPIDRVSVWPHTPIARFSVSPHTPIDRVGVSPHTPIARVSESPHTPIARVSVSPQTPILDESHIAIIIITIITHCDYYCYEPSDTFAIMITALNFSMSAKPAACCMLTCRQLRFNLLQCNVPYINSY